MGAFGGDLRPIPIPIPLQLQDDTLRDRLLATARGEVGVRERTGRNDGPRVGEYLAYTGLGEGHAWCAAFVSWCFGQIGLEQPRNAWSPALFPRARHIAGHREVQPGDLFGLYDTGQGRIHHVGFVERMDTSYLISIEGNSRDRVERRRRPLRTIHVYADWLKGEGAP